MFNFLSGSVAAPKYSTWDQQQSQEVDPVRMGYGNSSPMALYSLYGMSGNQGGQLSTLQKPSAMSAPAAPQVPTVPIAPFGPPTPSAPPTPPAPYVSGRPYDASAPSVGSRVQPGSPLPLTPGQSSFGTPIPKPGMQNVSSTTPVPDGPPPLGSASSAAQAGQNWMNQYTSPAYAQWYNSLPSHLRAYAHAPGNPATAQYLYDQGAHSYATFGNNPNW